MRRFLLVFLLCLLPLQFSHAAVSAYAEQVVEEGTHPHHDHASQADDHRAVDANDRHSGDSVSCEACHHHCCSFVDAGTVSVTAQMKRETVSTVFPACVPQHEPEPSYRPPIVSLA